MASEPTATQPSPVPDPSPTGPLQRIQGQGIKARLAHYRSKVSSKEGWVGDYDFVWLCSPTLPGYETKRTKARKDKAPPFFGLNDDLPLLLALICGLQHALAMLAGLITPPILFSSALNLPPNIQVRIFSRLLGMDIDEINRHT
jgi:hypothetical protein